MILFASPDFGTGATAILIFLLFFLVVFFAIGIAVALAIRFLMSLRKSPDGQPHSHSRSSPVAKVFFVLVCGATVSVLGTCLLPRTIFCIINGRDRVDPNTFHVEEGMTKEEVVAKYGQPHEKPEEGRWFYYVDKWGCGVGLIKVDFDEQGRVTGYWWD